MEHHERRLAHIVPAMWICLFVGSLTLGCDDEPTTDGDADADGDVDSDGDADSDGDGDGDGDGDADPPVPEWDELDYEYRVTVTIRAHPDRDRIDLPVFATFEHDGSYVSPDVLIYELTDETTSAIPGDAWTEPDGGGLEVGFIAPGVTTTGSTRTFLVYYNTSSDAPSWSYDDGSWGSFELVDIDGNENNDGFALNGGSITLQREIAESVGSLRRGRRFDGATFLDLDGWRAIEGFSTGYQLETDTATYDSVNAAEPVTAVIGHRSETSVAASATWTGLENPVAHDLSLTYRVFRDLPFVESVLSVDPDSLTEGIRFSSAGWSGRTLYMANDDYDTMISDTRDEESLSPVWDTSMRWLVIRDDETGRGFGWFLSTARGVVRANDEDGMTIYDSYGYASGRSTRLRYLWMASTSADTIVDLFDAMIPGVEVSDSEHRDLNIVRPDQGDFLFPEDELDVRVTTPGNISEVTASLLLADGRSLELELSNAENPLIWRSTAPLALTSEHPEGTWTVTAESDGLSRHVQFEFRVPSHPHLLFSSDELEELRARRETTHSVIWAEMLRLAESYDEPIPDPGPGRDIRRYGERLTNLALIQLIDSAQPFDEQLWTYFFTMLRYPNWDDGEVPFNNLDLTVGHFLTALALVYDWHYESLTPSERAEVRDRLRTVTDDWIGSSWMRTYRDIEWQSYGTVTNNHYWINHEGVAAAAFVLADEIPESERIPWVNHLEEDLSIILSVLEDDGTSHEGVAYHSYGQINLFPWLDMRDRVFGETTAVAFPWFENSVLFDAYSILPGGDDNYGGVANFGDCPPRHYNPPRTIDAWLARSLRNGLAQDLAENLDWPHITVMSYLWYDPSVDVMPVASLPNWHLFENKGIFVWRSSWDDDATYFSLKGGSYFGGHEQPDAGHFILHRAGIPYITDHGYSYRKETDEHNLIMVNGTGQYGDGVQWMDDVDPEHWAETSVVVADDRFFMLSSDPTPMYRSDELESWTREVVGLGSDIVVVHDEVQSSASVEIDWLLHSYRSVPPTSVSRTYGYSDQRLENPFSDSGSGAWLVTPQDGALPLRVEDVSHTSWVAVVEPSVFVPEQDPDSGTYNEGLDSFAVGYRLRRTQTSANATSTVALWFGESIEAERESSAGGDAVRFHTATGDVAFMVWPSSGSSSIGGYDVTGTMGGRWMEEPAFFGRNVTSIVAQGETLFTSSNQVDLFAKTEDSSSARYCLIRAPADSTLTIRCPDSPTELLLDGATTGVSWSGGVITASVSAGEHRIEAR